jgi:hypothetical protein
MVPVSIVRREFPDYAVRDHLLTHEGTEPVCHSSLALLWLVET